MSNNFPRHNNSLTLDTSMVERNKNNVQREIQYDQYGFPITYQTQLSSSSTAVLQPSGPSTPAYSLGHISTTDSFFGEHSDGGVMQLSTDSAYQLGNKPLAVEYLPKDRGKGEQPVTLMYSKHEKIPMKDFASEIRASMDVENFLSKTLLFLDVHERNTELVLENMLKSLLADEKCTVAEAKKAMFTHDAVRKLSKTIQGTTTFSDGCDIDQTWTCILVTLPTVEQRHVAVARLRHPANLDRNAQEIVFIILVVSPAKLKGTKNAIETGRTFSTLFSDSDLRHKLIHCHTEEEFKRHIKEHTLTLLEKERERRFSEDNLDFKDMATVAAAAAEEKESNKKCQFGIGLINDLKRRLPVYISDYKDGIFGHKTIHKTAATTVFLYFSCLLPSIAFGVLNATNTDDKIDVKKVIIMQTFGGLLFAILGGQPMVIILTTAPLALYTKVVANISADFNLDFYAMYAAVGLWNMFFLIVYSLFGLSRLMKWSTRSTEEIFALFISIAFTVDAVKAIVKDFQHNYDDKTCKDYHSLESNFTGNISSGGLEDVICPKSHSLLFLLLTMGTLWVGISLFKFTSTPYLSENKREILADYALPVAVLFMSFIGSFVFKDIKLEKFKYDENFSLNIPPLRELSAGAIFGAMGLGFCLSLLFFMDQNISAAMVNSPSNKMKKGSAYHWDLLVIALINGILSFFGMPMCHGALPHSPLHVRAMADVEERVDQGHISTRIVSVRETRLTAIISHILIGLSILMLPIPLTYIPKAVLYGLFLYLAVTALGSIQMFDRILLMLTEQAAYPPNHYIRAVPQRKIHFFTLAQLLQLLVLCAFGFSPWPYLKMCFPVLILLLLPIRHKLVPFIIEKKYLQFLDGH